MNVYQILGQNAYWTVNKAIARAVSINAALLLADLISKREYFIINKDIKQSDWFFNTVENIETDTTLSKYQQSQALKQLENAGLLQISYKGSAPRKRHFKINDDKILELLGNADYSVDHQSSKNLTISGKKTEPLEVKKLNHSYNNNKGNDNKPNKNKEINYNSKQEIIFSFDVCLSMLQQNKRVSIHNITERTLDLLVDEGYAVDPQGYITKLTYN